MSNPPPGFKMPPPSAPPSNSSPYPQYPPQPQQPTGYPQQSQPQPYYPAQQAVAYPPPAYTNQPFPQPLIAEPGVTSSVQTMGWFANTDFAPLLRGAASFHVKQKIELLEVLTGWETSNRYVVKDQLGNKVFYVGEQSDILNLQCCGASRRLRLLVKDMRGLDVLRFERPLNCSCCCGLFCSDSIAVSTGAGQYLGSVEEEFSLLTPCFAIKDFTGKTQLRIEGPVCVFSCFATSVNFKVMNVDGVIVGTISKEWSGWVRELFTDADYFSMSFPPDMDPSVKAVCLAALFLIDYEYFEHGHDGRQNHGRLGGFF